MSAPSSDQTGESIEEYSEEVRLTHSTAIDGVYRAEPIHPDTPSRIKKLKAKIAKYQQMFLLITFTSAAMTFQGLPSLNYVKDVLKVSPAELLLFNSTAMLLNFFKPFIGYIEDRYSICGYRVKSYVLVYAIGSSILCLSIASNLGHISLFCLQLSTLSLLDCIGVAVAEGMTVITLKYQKELADIDGSTEKTGEGANFGYHQVLGNIVRLLFTFLGGYYGTEMPFAAVFYVMSVLPMLVLAFTVLSFEEDSEYYRKTRAEAQSGQEQTFFSKLDAILRILSQEDLKMPVGLLVASFMVPNYADSFVLILTDPKMGGWSMKNFAFLKLVLGVVYAGSMSLLLARLQKFRFDRLFFLCGISYLICSVGNTSFAFADRLGFGVMFALQLGVGLVGWLGTDCAVIQIMGRFSSRCPKGLENLGVSCLGTLNIIGMSIGGYISSSFLAAFHVAEGQYGNIFVPMVFGVCGRLMILWLIAILVRS